MTLVGSAHRLFVNGSFVGRAVSSERVTIPQFGTATQTVTVYLENLVLARKAMELGNAPAIAYRLDSQLQPADGGRYGGIKTSTTGELDLSGLTAGGPPCLLVSCRLTAWKRQAGTPAATFAKVQISKPVGIR